MTADSTAAMPGQAIAAPRPDTSEAATARRTRAQILAAINAAAIEVFAREGLTGATTQMIAEQAGLSAGRFPTRRCARAS